MKPWEQPKRGWRFVKRGYVRIGDEFWCERHQKFCRVYWTDYEVKDMLAVRRKVKP